MASLLILKGTNPGQRVELIGDRIVLGRNPDCHVVINLPAVSREHSQIVRVQGQFFVEDGDGERPSRNGSFVNNQQIAGRTLLHNDDRIKICDFLCSFHDANAPKALPRDMRPPETETDDEPEGSSTVEATMGRLSSNQLLESQPAEKIKALLDITTNLSKTLQLDPLLPKIADSLFQLFRQADRCFLILREDGTDRLIPKMIQTRRPHAEATARFSKTIVKRCLETGESVLSEDAQTDSKFGLSQSIADFRIRSVMCVPLCPPDSPPIGVIQLDTQDRTKKFTQDELKLLVGVANQAAIALENAKSHETLLARERYQRDLELAREVQRGFLPHGVPEVPGYDFFAHYEAALEVGGDYYDFIPLSQQRLGILLGDVAGKGVPAALLMAKLSAEARFCMLTESDPAAGISRLNDLLLQAGLLDRFVTLIAVVLDPVKHTATLINAGHPPPLLYRPETQELEKALTYEMTGLPLGVEEGFRYASHPVELAPGDCLLVFTDGVTDALSVHNEAFDFKGIYTTVDGAGPFTAAALGERVVKAVKQHSAGRDQHDDIALVCLGRQP